MKFELKFLLDNEISPASIDSMQMQLTEVIATAIEEKQIEIPDAEIEDYAVGIDEEYREY